MRAGSMARPRVLRIGGSPARSDHDRMALEDFVDLKLDHHTKDGIEIVDVEGEIDVYTAPRLRELLIELVNSGPSSSS